MDSQARLGNTCWALRNWRHPCLFPGRAGAGAVGEGCVRAKERIELGFQTSEWDFSRDSQGHVDAGESQTPALVALQVPGIPFCKVGKEF